MKRKIKKEIIRRERKISNGILERLFIIILFFLIINIFSLHNVGAIGITPGRTTMNFEPGLEREVSFSVVNTEHKDMNVVFFVRGALNQSITLHETFTEFSSDEESKSFSYSVRLPQSIDKPGRYDAEVVALELPKDVKEKGSFVGATMAVVTQLYVFVPYPGKYAEAELNIVGNEQGQNLVFFVQVTNRGKLDIVNAKAIIDIYTALNEKLASIETDERSISSKERGELTAEWQADVNPGKYLAKVTLMYDDETLNFEKEFSIGEMLLEISEIYVKDFELGGIAKFDIIVENKWGEELKDVYVNIVAYNEENEIMADFKSPTQDIPALTKTKMVAYWDTAGVKAGTYNGKVILNYNQKTNERDVKIKVARNSIAIVGATGRVVVKGKGRLNLQNILIVAVIVLIIINIIWFVVVRKRLLGGKKGVGRVEKTGKSRRGVEIIKK